MMKVLEKKNERILLEIKDGSHLSLNDIHLLKSEKCSILRSAHVGNLDVQTLFLAQEGFKVVLDEYAKGSMRVYRPAYEIKNNNELSLCMQDDLPATHLSLANKLYKQDSCVATYHYRNLKTLFPNSITITSTHLLRQKSFVYKSFKILIQKRPCSFSKLIEHDGKIFKFDKTDKENIYFCDDFGNKRIFKISSFPDLVMSSLEYTETLLHGGKKDSVPIITLDVDTDISLITLCDINWNREISETHCIKLIHFSGLEMFNYMINNKKLANEHLLAMSEIFNLLIHVWTQFIPEKLEMFIVPTDSLPCFICETKEELKLFNDMFLSEKNITTLNKKRSVLWKKIQNQTFEYVSSLSDECIISLIKKIDTYNTPNSFIKNLHSIGKKISEGISVERAILNRIIINYFLYKKVYDAGIANIDDMIFNEKKNLEKVNTIPLVSISQYDMLLGKEIYFSNMARSLTMDELRSYKRKIKRKKINNKNFCNEILKSPRLNELLEHFERISNGSEQVPKKLPKINKTYLQSCPDFLRHEQIFRKNIGVFFKHGISSIPYLSEELLRVDKAIYDFAVYKGATKENPLTYWETSSADGTRARTLSEYANGIIITLTDSPNLGNKVEFENSPPHPYSFFHYGPFIDICPKYLASQNLHKSFKSGFDVIWENTTFQMYGNNRLEQIEYVSQSLKPDGLLILFEKMNSENDNDYRLMEDVKDEFKRCYFDTKQIQKKKENILNTMEKGQVTIKQMINIASKFYKYGSLIWNSANFYEIVVSNSKENIECFLRCLPKAFVPKKFKLESQMVIPLWGEISIPVNH